jgi:hypothetical protein
MEPYITHKLVPISSHPNAIEMWGVFTSCQSKQSNQEEKWYESDYHQLMNVQYSFKIGGKNIIILDESSWRT